jgi:hypothetical protein
MVPKHSPSGLPVTAKETDVIYEFKSRATGSVVMTGAVAEQMLGIVGKAAGPTGIFTVEQMGPAIAALKAAVEHDESLAKERAAAHGPDTDQEASPDREDRQPAISLRQRAWPLIDMLQAAQRAEQVVTWGV